MNVLLPNMRNSERKNRGNRSGADGVLRQSCPFFPRLAVLIFAAVLPLSIGADDVAISGVDARLIGVSGAVDLYAVATDTQGRLLANLEKDDFVLKDAPSGEAFGDPLDISGFSTAGERRDGISFLMLIDDSGSMYDGPDGKLSPAWEDSRAALARREARRFLDDLGGSLDRAGLALFGTRYRVVAGPRTDRGSLMDRLGVSSAPEQEEAYTELYAAIAEASKTMGTQRGRRIVIVFSDGENYPFHERTGDSHPDFGEKKWNPEDSLDALKQEAVTLYAVRFGNNKDDSLGQIARATGGLVFDVDGEESLSGLYSSIRERVLNEYRISYRPRPTGASETRVKLSLSGADEDAEIAFPSMFVFGSPAEKGSVLYSLLAIPFAALLLLLLLRLRAASSVSEPSLDRLRPMGGGAATVVLSSGKTLISPGAGGAATTILPADSRKSTGERKSSSQSAKTSPDKPAAGTGTIIVEKGADGRWRASSSEGLVVNNRRSDATILENGDVIRAGEELIVFDDGEK